MSTLADPDSARACCDRLARLEPATARRWGRMTAHQMVCHLYDSFQVALGRRQVSPAASPLPRKWVKWIALRSSLPWAHNVPTRPEIKQGLGGTAPANWDQDRENVRQMILTFASNCRPGTHPMFGPMTETDWHIWAWRHVDHHLRQFGL
ncbi:MAG TPA: DinB family protein [Bryobacteraceae bacterium]|jgi:hypothetical protein